MVIKADKCVYIATTAYGATDGELISALFGCLPPDIEMRRIIGKESKYLFSKNKIIKGIYFITDEATTRLHGINDGLEFTMTSQGDIIVYRKNNFRYTLEEILDSYERYIKEDNKMVIEANKYIYIATNTGAWNDDRLIEALLGYMPADREHHNITPCGFLWSKNKLLKDNWFNVDDANERLYNLDRKLKFTVTGRGDIIIYKDIYDDVSKIFEVYNKIISQENKEAKNEDLKMTIEANNYIYIACNTTGFSDGELISALLGYVPTYTKYENIHGDDLLWSRTKFLHERSFVFNDAERRLHERDKNLDFVMTEKGDIIIYRNTNNHTLKDILDAYDKYSKRDVDNDKLRKRYVSMASDSNFSLNCQPILTMPRNLGRSAAMSMLNSIYGLNPSFQAGLLRWGDWDSGFKLYFGVERATGKQKTVCIWKDGDKTIIRGDKSVLTMPVQCAVAWCYVKRRFKTISQFKKYVDDRSFVMDGMTYFEGDTRVKGAQASVNNRTKKYDIYDAAALAITAKHYGSVKTIMTYCDGWGE